MAEQQRQQIIQQYQAMVDREKELVQRVAELQAQESEYRRVPPGGCGAGARGWRAWGGGFATWRSLTTASGAVVGARHWSLQEDVVRPLL